MAGSQNEQRELSFADEERVRHMELLVEKVNCTYREMESCVRLDC
jgi:hypothetical protein